MYPNSTEKEQFLRQLNDQLLHKYIISKTKYFWMNALTLGIFLFLFVLIGGFFANKYIGLQWPVIIVILVTILAGTITSLIYNYKLSESELGSMPIMNVRKRLQNHISYLRIGMYIGLIVVPILFVWLAFQVREALTVSFLSVTIDDTDASIFFYIILAIGFISTIAIVPDIISRISLMNSLIRDIDTYSAEKVA